MADEVTPAEVTLRPGTPADAAEAAPLIHAAGPALYDRLFGPRPEDAVRFFEALFGLPDSLFSYENATVAEAGGRVVGLALAVTAAQYRRGAALPRQLLRRGLPFLMRLLPAAFALRRSTLPPPPDSLYLGILSVAAPHRSGGIGGRLLEEVGRRAQEAGCAGVCLHAERDNAGARRFYERHGYRITHEHPTPRAARWGVAGFVGMRKEIHPPAAAPSGYTVPAQTSQEPLP